MASLYQIPITQFATRNQSIPVSTFYFQCHFRITKKAIKYIKKHAVLSTGYIKNPTKKA